MSDELTKVILTEPGIAGSYVLEERHEDGSLLLRPDTSIAAIRERAGTRPMSAEQFDKHFGHRPARP